MTSVVERLPRIRRGFLRNTDAPGLSTARSLALRPVLARVCPIGAGKGGIGSL